MSLPLEKCIYMWPVMTWPALHRECTQLGRCLFAYRSSVWIWLSWDRGYRSALRWRPASSSNYRVRRKRKRDPDNACNKQLRKAIEIWRKYRSRIAIVASYVSAVWYWPNDLNLLRSEKDSSVSLCTFCRWRTHFLSIFLNYIRKSRLADEELRTNAYIRCGFSSSNVALSRMCGRCFWIAHRCYRGVVARARQSYSFEIISRRIHNTADLSEPDGPWNPKVLCWIR